MTDLELLFNLEKSLFKIDLLTQNDKIKLEDVLDYLPGWIHLNRKKDFALTGLSGNMENEWEITSEEAKKAGMKLITERIHDITLQKVVPPLQQFYETGDLNQVFGFFQLIRSRPNENYRWYYTVTKINRKLECTISQSVPLLKISPFLVKAKELLGHNDFLNKNFAKFQTLTKREKEILQRVACGNSNQQIADELFVSVLTIKTHRQNINRKLGINKINDYLQYASVFGLM